MKVDPPKLAGVGAPDAFELRELIASANLRDGENDDKRALAINSLHGMYLKQLANVRHGEERLRPGVDRRLTDFFDGLALRIWAAHNPLDKLKALLTTAARRGPKVKKADRDFEIAVCVARLRRGGASKEYAVAETARIEGISESRAKKILKNVADEFTPQGLRAEAAFVEQEVADKAAAEKRLKGKV